MTGAGSVGVCQSNFSWITATGSGSSCVICSSWVGVMLWVVLWSWIASVSKVLGACETSGTSEATSGASGASSTERALAEFAGRDRVDAVGGRGFDGLVLYGNRWGRSFLMEVDVGDCLGVRGGRNLGSLFDGLSGAGARGLLDDLRRGLRLEIVAVGFAGFMPRRRAGIGAIV